MSESSEKLSGANPAELWMKWYESSSRMWTDALRGSRESQADPWGLYRQWTESMEEARKSITGAGGGAVGGPEAAKSVERMMSAMAPAGSMGGAMDPERMNKWLEEASRSWQKSAQVGSEMISAAPRWIQLMEQARDNMINAEGGVPSDPLQFVVQWYNATSGPLSEFVQDLLERDEFLEPSSRFSGELREGVQDLQSQLRRVPERAPATDPFGHNAHRHPHSGAGGQGRPYRGSFRRLRVWLRDSPPPPKKSSRSKTV